MDLIEKIIKDLTSAKYEWGDGKFESDAVDHRAIPVVTEILYRDLGEETRRNAELEAKCFAYEAVISNSNFAPVLESERNQEPNKLTEETIMAIWGALIEYGNHDHQFHLGDTIKYDPDEVADILRQKFIGGMTND